MDNVKKKTYIIMISLFIIFLFVFSLLFKNVFVKLSGDLTFVSKNDYLKQNPNSYPVIVNVFNSSGGKVTNNDVALTINARSLYNIIGLEYSFDLNNWYKIDKKFNSKEINEKIVFRNSMDKMVYIRVENNLNLKSYPYETYVKIDKEKPVINLLNNEIIASDNDNIYKLQYFNDLSDYTEEDVYSKKINTSETKECDYVRAVDMAGNISDAVKLTK